jgi:uncharacterized protein YbjT (DUF2867 family)
MNVLIAGAGSYLGRRLKSRLLEDPAVRLRLLVRDHRSVSEPEGSPAEVMEGDISDRATVRRAVEGMDVVYYPIRLLGSLLESDEFSESSVEMFRDVCVEAGVRRLVYVGLHTTDAASTNPLKSVAETGKILTARPRELPTVWFRVGVITGSGSLTFELIRNVVQKIPLIFVSPWMETRLSAVGVDAVLDYLVMAKDIDLRDSVTVDICSEQLSFKDMMKSAAAVTGLRRLFVPLPLRARPLSSFLLMLAAPFSFRLSSRLIRVLQSGAIAPFCAKDVQAERYFPGVVPAPFERALGNAIAEMERDQVMSRWVDTLEKTFEMSSEEEVSRAVYRDTKRLSFGDVPSPRVFRALKSMGGRKGWFTFDVLWRIRGFLDKLAGGCGTTMGKRCESDLRVGDMLDVWKVVDLRENQRLLLEAQMKVFGKAWLEFRIDGNTLVQTAYHLPKGLLGRLYWYSMFPFHLFIFRDMIRNIVKEAREMQ